MQLTDEQQRGIQAAWRVCMSQSKRVLQQREVIDSPNQKAN